MKKFPETIFVTCCGEKDDQWFCVNESAEASDGEDHDGRIAEYSLVQQGKLMRVISALFKQD